MRFTCTQPSGFEPGTTWFQGSRMGYTNEPSFCKAFTLHFCIFVGCEGGLVGGHVYDHCTSLLLSKYVSFQHKFISHMCHEPKMTIAVHTYEKPYSVVLLISPPLRIFFERQKLWVWEKTSRRWCDDKLMEPCASHVVNIITVDMLEWSHKLFNALKVGHIASQQVACYPSSTPTLDYFIFLVSSSTSSFFYKNVF
jgi:hypothetical protein